MPNIDRNVNALGFIVTIVVGVNAIHGSQILTRDAYINHPKSVDSKNNSSYPSFMIKNYSQLLIGIIVGLVAELLIGKLVFVNNSPLLVAQDQNRQTETAKRSNNPSLAESGNTAVSDHFVDVNKMVKIGLDAERN